MKPKAHKHAELIKVWADGAKIQLRGKWGWHDAVPPHWEEYTEYRIKPAEKVVRWLWAYKSPITNDFRVSAYYTEDEAFQCWHGVTFHKKLEWSREEFDE